MKVIRAAIFIAATALIAQDGVVEGTVTNSVTGAGISGASVSLSGGGSAHYEATSDVAGHFKITGIAPGSYSAVVQQNGFAPPLFLLGPGLRVGSGGNPVKVELKLAPFDTVHGRVLGPDAKPLPGVEVSVYPNIMADTAITDQEGRFKLENLRPGSYTLVAKPPDSAQPERASDGTRTAMVTTYYPSVADRSLVQPIVLHGEGDSGNGYDIRMQTAPVYRMRGIVLDGDGKPVPGAELSLLPSSEGGPAPMGLSTRTGGLSLFALGMRPLFTGVPEATAIASDDGHFEFPAVRSADWSINAASDQTRGAAEASVSRSDLDDLQVHVAMPFNLTGTIESKSDDPVSQRLTNPQPLFTPMMLMDPDGHEFLRFGTVASGGLLFENIVPGNYKAVVQPGLSAQIFLGQNEVTGTFSVTPGGPPLRVVLKTWSGSVRGTVEKGDGATVVLIPQRVDRVALGQSVVCGAGGSFELNEVSPGDYYIAAFEHLDGRTPSAAMLGLVPSRGTSVKVEERSTADVTLSMIAAPR